MLKQRSNKALQRERSPREFEKIVAGSRRIEDATLNLGTYKKVNSNYGNKTFVLDAIYRHDYKTLREISTYFYEASGIYYRLCNYLAKLYKYDWYVTPYKVDGEKTNKILKDFSNVLTYLDNSEIKRLCDKMALDIITEGVYYGIVVDFGDKVGLQKLPPAYCRTRYYSGIQPIVELNLEFFNAFFPNWQYKEIVLKTFPKDIQKAYVLYQQGKLKGDYPGERGQWYPLDPGVSVKLSLNDSDFPPFVSVIPSIIDLDQAQDLDRKKTMQQLLKIIVQKLPLDKNGTLIFDLEEAETLHDNAVKMLRRSIGIDVLTTFAEVDKIDVKDTNSSTTVDDLEKAERTVYNNAGVAHNLFNAEGNLATTNSILVDEAHMRDLPRQFATLFTRIISKFNRKNHYSFRVDILETTQFNYRELSKMYKDAKQTGGPKMLDLIALGHTQSSILATINFENEVLNLAEIMIPPMMSSTMSGKQLEKNKNQEEKKPGRPEKPEEEKSDKTLINRESAQ